MDKDWPGDGGGEISPRDRIIFAAEKLFASKGLHGAGLREIAREANVNVNLIGYHFENKENLYRRVHETRARQINKMREQALAELDRRYPDAPPPVEEVIRAFVHPFFILKSIDPEVWVAFIRTYFREIGTEVWREVTAATLAPAVRRFADILHRSLPTSKRSDILFVLGLAIHGAMMSADADEAAMVGEGLVDDQSPDQLEERLIRALTSVAQQYS